MHESETGGKRAELVSLGGADSNGFRGTGNEPAHNRTPDRPMPIQTGSPMVLQRLLLRACRSAGSRLKMADSLGTRLTGREALTRILAAKSVLDRVLAADEKMVGVLLPPTAGAAIVNAALALSGRVAVNLNYTASQAIVDLCIDRAGLKHVISSPAWSTTPTRVRRRRSAGWRVSITPRC